MKTERQLSNIASQDKIQTPSHGMKVPSRSCLVPAIQHCLGFPHILPISLSFPPTFHFEYILKVLKNITVSIHMSTTQILLLFYCTSFYHVSTHPFIPLSIKVNCSHLQSFPLNTSLEISTGLYGLLFSCCDKFYIQ